MRSIDLSLCGIMALSAPFKYVRSSICIDSHLRARDHSQPITHSLIHSFTHSLIHSFTHSLIHSSCLLSHPNLRTQVVQSRDAAAKTLSTARAQHRLAIRSARARADSSSPRKGSIKSLFDKEMAHMYDSGKVCLVGSELVHHYGLRLINWLIGWFF